MSDGHGFADDIKIPEDNPVTEGSAGDFNYSSENEAKPCGVQDVKLHEMGEALEVAENRCHILKQQLDQMKNLYRQKNLQSAHMKEQLLADIAKSAQQNCTRNRPLIRQNSEAIATDSSGAAILTINNILSGITNSINRLSELHNCMDSDIQQHNKSKQAENNPQEEILQSNNQQLQMSEGNNSTTVVCRKKDKKKVKRKVVLPNESSVSMLRDEQGNLTSRRQRRRLKRLNRFSKTSILRKNNGRFPKDHISMSNNLVELYHNEAAKTSESDENEENRAVVVPSRKLSRLEMRTRIRKAHLEREARLEDLSPIQETINITAEAILRNYQTPTIASRMKQVTRCYFRHPNPKMIPFCPAISTSPSHNIGINIQQVMNIIKTRQPLRGISPTLAYNIGIAADKLNHRSLSAIVSSLGTRIGYMPCPLGKNNVNYQQMQEAAKEISDIPEDDEDEVINEQSNTQETLWTLDPDKQTTCTCIPQQGVNFQQVLNKYNNHSSPRNQYSQHVLKRTQQRYKHVKSVYAGYRNPGSVSMALSNSTNNTITEATMPLKGKEKILKSVLMNLHDEFKQLSDKYDELGAKGDQNEGARQELEALERRLGDKEMEIQMVMSLYTEVVNLKEQVKALRDKASLASIVVEQHKNNIDHAKQSQGIRNVRDPPVAVHLTKLLRQIQAYKGNTTSK